MKYVASFAAIVWITSLWFLYPFPFQEIELIKEIEASAENVGMNVWIRWIVVTCYVLLGIYFSVMLYIRQRVYQVALIGWSAIYLGYVFLHFFRSALAFETSLLASFIRQWEGTLALQDLVAQVAFIHAFILLPVSHVVILLILMICAYQSRWGKVDISP